MDRVGADGEWVMNLVFVANLAPNVTDEITVGSVWGPGIIEYLRFGRGATDVSVRGFIYPGRLPLREGLGSEALVLGDGMMKGATDLVRVPRESSIFAETATETDMRIGRLVPWEFWTLVLRLESISGIARDVSGHFVIRVLGRSILPLPAFWERGTAPHLARLGSGSHHALVR